MTAIAFTAIAIAAILGIWVLLLGRAKDRALGERDDARIRCRAIEEHNKELLGQMRSDVAQRDALIAQHEAELSPAHRAIRFGATTWGKA